MYSVVRPVGTFVVTSLVGSLLALALGACTPEEFGENVASETSAVSIDAVQACPIPTPNDIPGHENLFYQCAELHADFGRGCGESGYLLGYGSKYAQRFYRQARPRMSTRGQKWIDDVLVCLQHDLREAIDETTTCDDIWTTAFDSHPSCYVRAGFCTLPPLDIAQVVWTVDAKDWLSRDAARQILHTASSCGREYAGFLRFLFWYLVDQPEE